MDLTEMGIPRRTAFLSPPATPESEPESFESRLKRLCTFNQLRVGPVVAQLNLSGHEVRSVLGSKMNEPFHLLSLGGLVSKKWRLALEPHVDRHIVRGVTWQEALPDKTLPTARTTLQWCPDCYEEDAKQKHGPYDRLLWTAAEVSVCPKHRRLLVHTCPHCEGKDFRPLFADQCSGFCPLCMSWLGNVATRTGEQVLDPYAIWLATELANVLASRHYGSADKRSSIIDELLDKHFEGVGAKMAKALGRSKTTVWNWLATGVPSFESKLELAYVFGISLRDMLRGNTTAVRKSTFHADRAAAFAEGRPARKPPTHYNLEEVQLFISAVASGAYPEIMTIDQVCTALNIDRKVLTRHFPEATTALSLQLNAKREEFRQAVRDQRLGELVDAVAEVLKAKGPWVKRRELFEELAGRLAKPVQRHEASLVWTLATQRKGEHSYIITPDTLADDDWGNDDAEGSRDAPDAKGAKTDDPDLNGSAADAAEPGNEAESEEAAGTGHPTPVSPDGADDESPI